MGITTFLAAALITAPVDDPIPTPISFPVAAIAAQALAVELEILDPRELKYVLSRLEDFAADVKLLRARWRDLHDAPALHDAMRLPDRALLNDLLSFNRSYRMHLQSQADMNPPDWWELREAMVETDNLYHLWDTVRDARAEYYYVTVKRAALKKLRDQLGPQAWSSGCLPAHVPYGRFSRMP